MENQDINFIANGKQFGNKIQISFDWETLKKLKKHEFQGNKYLTIDVIPLKETGKFGHTHTVVEHIYQEQESKN